MHELKKCVNAVFVFPAGAEGASVGPSGRVRAGAGRSHGRQGQQEPAVRSQARTPVHHHREKGPTHTTYNIQNIQLAT